MRYRRDSKQILIITVFRCLKQSTIVRSTREIRTGCPAIRCVSTGEPIQSPVHLLDCSGPPQPREGGRGNPGSCGIGTVDERRALGDLPKDSHWAFSLHGIIPDSEVKKGIVWLGGLWWKVFFMKTTTTTPHQTMHDFCHPLFASRQVQLRSTLQPITPFGGPVSRISFFNKIALPAPIGAAMPFCCRSPNAIAPAQPLVAFLIPVVAGARRLAHTGWLRADRALHALPGIERFPGTDTVRNFFRRFNQGSIEAFWRPMGRWLLGLGWPVPTQGFSLDPDSTLLQRSGSQQGAARGYNPARPGRNSHYPLLAFLAGAPVMLHAWLRSGNTGASRGVREFLCEAMALLPQGWKLRMVRADSGFFDQNFLEFLERRSLPCIVVARLMKTIKARAGCLKKWVQIDGNCAWAEMTLPLQGWSRPRRFIVIRELVHEKKEAVGRNLIDVPGYTFRVIVTNCQGDGAELWRDDNKRASVEQQIGELKNDLQVQGFCMLDFSATGSAFLAVCFTFKLLSLCQHVAGPKGRQGGFRRPASLRTEVFLGGAVPGNRGRQPVLYIAGSRGGLEKHKPLLESVLLWPPGSSPKLPPEGGGAGENGCSYGSGRLAA